MSRIESLKNEIKELQEKAKVIDPLNQKIYQLKQELEKEENKTFVGRCFKFNNSMPHDEVTTWLYCQVIDINNHGDMVIVDYETSPRGSRIETHTYPSTAYFVSQYIGVSDKDFKLGSDQVLKALKLRRAR
jgi:hypothetical protein